MKKNERCPNILKRLVRCENCDNYYGARPTRKLWFITLYGWGICAKEHEIRPRDVNAEWSCEKHTLND